MRKQFDERFRDTAKRFSLQLAGWYGGNAARKIEYAEAFEICEYGRRPDRAELARLFPFFGD